MQRLAASLHQYRIFPRIFAIFTMIMCYTFHEWFTQSGQLKVSDMQEWALIGYASVMGTYVAFFKFYMDSGRILEKD